ncbi:hypothetical protein [Evansella tamaricis]|uniref:Glycosyltransferase 2-like domain-containing protein n=1 Tax=Evansella tamaricis TaxID=2069301 RepID=A0ABS6JI12_9BACI|nr:hypothetical protein [Evansella tamaricis]MBU9713312.1 hypothetical protein [Evansella tamaricis]
MICIGMAVIPSRFKNLEESIPLLLKQCDQMFVHVNGATICPEFLKQHSKIKLSCSKQNKGAEMKFIGYNQTDGYYLTVDDDFLYPEDYVKKLIKVMKAYNNQIIACVHGSTFHPEKTVKNIAKNRKVFTSHKQLQKHTKILIPGTGTSCFYTKNMKISPEAFQDTNMVDWIIGCKAAKKKIPVIAIRRGKNWLKPLYRKKGIQKDKEYKCKIDKLVQKNLLYFKKMY